MASRDEETGRGKSGPFHGRIERILDNAAKIAGLAKTQYKDWGKAESHDTRDRKWGEKPTQKRQGASRK